MKRTSVTGVLLVFVAFSTATAGTGPESESSWPPQKAEKTGGETVGNCRPDVKRAEESSAHPSPALPDDYLSHYYLHPDPSLIPEAMLEWDKSEQLRLGHMGPAGFLSEVFRENEHCIEEWTATVWQLGDLSREYLWLSLWFSDTPTARRILEDAARKETGKVADSAANLAGRPLTAPAVEREIDSPEVLDLLWGCFFATGREEFVVRIISCLEWTIEGKAGTAANQLIGHAALWSLKSNAAQHVRVFEICKEQRSKQPPATQQVLQEIIDEVTQSR